MERRSKDMVVRQAESEVNIFLNELNEMGIDVNHAFLSTGTLPSLSNPKEYLNSISHSNGNIKLKEEELDKFTDSISKRGLVPKEVFKGGNKIPFRAIKDNNVDCYIASLENEFKKNPYEILEQLDYEAKRRWRGRAGGLVIDENLLKPALMIAYSSGIFSFKQVVDGKEITKEQKEALTKKVYETYEKPVFSISIAGVDKLSFSSEILPLKITGEVKSETDTFTSVPEKDLKVSIQSKFLPVEVVKEIEKFYDVNEGYQGGLRSIWSGRFNYKIGCWSDNTTFETTLPEGIFDNCLKDVISDLQTVVKRSIGTSSLYNDLSGTKMFSEKERTVNNFAESIIEAGIVSEGELQKYVEEFEKLQIMPTQYKKVGYYLVGERPVFTPPVIGVSEHLRAYRSGVESNSNIYLTAIPKVIEVLKNMENNDIRVQTGTSDVRVSPNLHDNTLHAYVAVHGDKFYSSVIKANHITESLTKELLIAELF